MNATSKDIANRSDIYERVTERVIELLESEVNSQQSASTTLNMAFPESNSDEIF